MLVRTRFAPSPTGFLHVGGVRTALFSWLYAKHHQGEFFLRIEDTDNERSTQESVQAILDGMAWLQMDYKGEPTYQSQRYSRYQSVAEELLAEGKAYRCTCSKERLEALREAQLQAKKKPRYDGHCRDLNISPTTEPFVVRFKTPQTGEVSFVDKVYGEICVANQELDDLILIRSDGHPTYNFAVVIDDWDMAITHVIRGDDHVNNTPRQIHLYHALNAPLPCFAHLPMILGDDGKRLSKRHGAVSVLQFREEGVLPHALLNYLVRLGWSHGDTELFSREEMISLFDLAHVSRGVSSFNYEKLYWLNQHYLKTDDPILHASELTTQLKKAGLDPLKGPSPEQILTLFADRAKTLVEMVEKCHYFYQDTLVYDEDAVKKHLRPVILDALTMVYERLLQEQEWQAERLHQLIHDVCNELGISMGKLGQPLRVAVTGSSMSPAIDITLELIGKTRVLLRLNDALNRIREREAHLQTGSS